jgi:hypothetical protein
MVLRVISRMHMRAHTRTMENWHCHSHWHFPFAINYFASVLNSAKVTNKIARCFNARPSRKFLCEWVAFLDSTFGGQIIAATLRAILFVTSSLCSSLHFECWGGDRALKQFDDLAKIVGIKPHDLALRHVRSRARAKGSLTNLDELAIGIAKFADVEPPTFRFLDEANIGTLRLWLLSASFVAARPGRLSILLDAGGVDRTVSATHILRHFHSPLFFLRDLRVFRNSIVLRFRPARFLRNTAVFDQQLIDGGTTRRPSGPFENGVRKHVLRIER